MSIVTRGLSSPQALIVTHGLGAATVVIIIPVEQLVEVQEILQSISIEEYEIDNFVTDIGLVAITVEYALASEAITPVIVSELKEHEINAQVIEIPTSVDALTEEIINQVVDEKC